MSTPQKNSNIYDDECKTPMAYNLERSIESKAPKRERRKQGIIDKENVDVSTWCD